MQNVFIENATTVGNGVLRTRDFVQSELIRWDNIPEPISERISELTSNIPVGSVSGCVELLEKSNCYEINPAEILEMYYKTFHYGIDTFSAFFN